MSKIIAFSIRLDDPVVEGLAAIGSDKEWTISHVVRKILPLGLKAYLAEHYPNGLPVKEADK